MHTYMVLCAGLSCHMKEFEILRLYIIFMSPVACANMYIILFLKVLHTLSFVKLVPLNVDKNKTLFLVEYSISFELAVHDMFLYKLY